MRTLIFDTWVVDLDEQMSFLILPKYILMSIIFEESMQEC